MPRDIGDITEALLTANEIAYYEFLVVYLNAETLYLTNRPNGYTGTIGGISATWVEHDFEHGPIKQSWQDILVVNWVKFANLDYFWTNYSYSESLRGKKITLLEAWWNVSLDPEVLVDSYILFKGTFDDGEYKDEATITLKPHHIPWGTPIPWTKIGGKCTNDYKNPEDCQYAGAEPAGQVTCGKTRIDCNLRGNESHINIYDDCPKPGDNIVYGGSVTKVSPVSDTNPNLSILTNVPII